LKPETTAFLDKARECLEKGANMLADGWPDEAGRAPYLAGLDAAQALIVERTRRSIKRHREVQNESWRLTATTPHFDRRLRSFLGHTYNFKAIADYETGPDSVIAAEQAQEALATARRFVETIQALLTHPTAEP
jgi:uncharacterized protein (UPF0332 family)